MQSSVQISPAQLQQALDTRRDLFILDLRNPEEFANGQIEGASPVPMRNVPYFAVLETAETDDLPQVFADYAQKEWTDVLPRPGLTVVVCAKGSTSLLAAEGLQRLGYEAVSLEGGITAWGNFYAVRPVVEEEGFRLYQISRPVRGCLSYLLAADGEAVIIDPLRHTDQYLQTAAEQHLRVAAVLETHGHADHISGGPALAVTLGIPYYLHPYDAIHPVDVMPATIPYEPLRPNQVLSFGSMRIQALHIPGHTLGNLAYLVNDRYLLSGDSIFIRSVARPDLGGRGDAWAPLHYRSLARLLTLPDETLVLPGHFSHPGEADARGIYSRTLGQLKLENTDLRLVGEGESSFVAHLLAHLPAFPSQYAEIKRVNAGLIRPDEEKASDLELGRNICALSAAYTH